MAFTLPTLTLPSTPKAVLDVLRMEAGPQILPASKPLMGASLAAFAVGQAGLQYFDYPLGAGVVLYGLLAVALLVGMTFVVARFTGTLDRLPQFLIALGAAGAAYSLLGVVLHLLFAIVLPAPLPTARLLKFLLFPLLFWYWTVFTFIYRHASLRTIPAFALATLYVVFTNLIVSPLIK
ncbi:MAG: hypothetical protein HYS06_13555 [Methylocystis sp.]|nr:hypothetical protein [Methylocystis sp.]